jgi:F-type H+-transporting ATPase subunit c
MSVEMVTALGNIYAYTAITAGIILFGAGLGSALGWGLICSKYIEGIARQPEMKPQLMGQMLFTGGLMEAFPMIVLGLSMWFVTANPFVAAFEEAMKTAAKAAGG